MRSAASSLRTPFWAQQTARAPAPVEADEPFERRLSVLALGGQDRDVSGSGPDLFWLADDRDPKCDRPGRRRHGEPLGADRVEVPPAGDEHDVVAGLEQPAADNAADRTRSDDYEPQAPNPRLWT